MRFQMWLLLILAFALSGCGPRYVYHSYDKNYKLNEVKTAYVGEPLIKVSDSYCTSRQMSIYGVPSEDFTLVANFKRYGVLGEKTVIKAVKNKKYPVEYIEKEDGKVYNVVLIPDSNDKTIYGIMVDNLGNISSTKYYLVGPGVTPIDDTKISPENVNIMLVGKNPCEYGQYYKGGSNFELLYSGVNDVTMTIAYREYSPQDLAKQAFYQNLIYQTTAKQIRFKDFKIDLIEVDNEKIKYKVTEDNLFDSEFEYGKDEH